MHTNWLPGQNPLERNFSSKTVAISGCQDEPAHPAVSSLYSFRRRGTTIYRDLRRTSHIDSVRKTARQRLNCLSQLGKFNLTRELLVIFDTATSQSTLLSLSGEDWAPSTTGEQTAMDQAVCREDRLLQVQSHETPGHNRRRRPRKPLANEKLEMNTKRNDAGTLLTFTWEEIPSSLNKKAVIKKDQETSVRHLSVPWGFSVFL